MESSLNGLYGLIPTSNRESVTWHRPPSPHESRVVNYARRATLAPRKGMLITELCRRVRVRFAKRCAGGSENMSRSKRMHNTSDIKLLVAVAGNESLLRHALCTLYM